MDIRKIVEDHKKYQNKTMRKLMEERHQKDLWEQNEGIENPSVPAEGFEENSLSIFVSFFCFAREISVV